MKFAFDIGGVLSKYPDTYHKDWKTDGSEGDFGRRTPQEQK